MATKVKRRTRSVPDTAAELGVGDNKVLHLIRTGELIAHNLATDPRGRPRYAILDEDFARFLESRRVIPDGGKSMTHKLRRRDQAGVKQYF